MVNEYIEIENSEILKSITRRRFKSLNTAIFRLLPKGTKIEDHLATYRDHTRLGGKRAEGREYRYLDEGEEELGFTGVTHLGFKEGMFNISLPPEYISALNDYLKENDRFWYELLTSTTAQRREAA